MKLEQKLIIQNQTILTQKDKYGPYSLVHGNININPVQSIDSEWAEKEEGSKWYTCITLEGEIK